MLGASNPAWGRPGRRDGFPRRPIARGAAALLWKSTGRDELVAQSGAWNEAVLGHEFSCGDLLPVFVLRLEHLDPPALGRHEEALRADFRNLADLALHGAERADQRSEEHTSELQSHVNLVCR